MARGINPITWLSKVSGASMPNHMKLDAFEVAWDRRATEDTRATFRANLPGNGYAGPDLETETLVADLTAYTSGAAATSFAMQVTMPDLIKGALSTGSTLTATLQASIASPVSWTTVFTQVSSGSDSATPGYQFKYQNSNVLLVKYKLVMTLTGTTVDDLTDSLGYMDIIYNGNQRRKVKNLIGSLDTTHASTVTSDFDTFIDQATITNPRLYVANSIPDADLKVIVFTGEYKVDRISADRGEGRQATVLMSLTQEGSWVDE